MMDTYDFTAQPVLSEPMSYFALGAVVIITTSVIVAICAGVTMAVRALFTHAELVTPDYYRTAERLVDRPLGPGQFKPDLAYPAYPVRQARADAEAIKKQYLAVRAALLSWSGDTFIDGKHGPIILWWIVFPIPLVGLGMQPLLQLLLALQYLVLLAICLTARLVGGSIFLAVSGLLRLGDAVWSSARGASASCPTCFHVSPRPAYACPGCAELHRDIRSGRLGALFRRCDCGTLLPTTVFRAAWRLQARCQRCDEPLRRGAAVLRDIRVPVVGDPNAGKTRFIYASLHALGESIQRDGSDFAFVDEQSLQAAEQGFDLIESDRDTVKTSEDLPRALSVRVGKEPTGALLHLFDAAGELYRRPEAHDEMSFLDNGRALLFVVDPFSVPQLRAQISRVHRDVLDAHPPLGDPESTYGEVVSRIRSGGVKGKRQRLAVVITKVDLLERCDINIPAPDGLRDWLYELGLHNVVLAATRDFNEVNYFAVASVARSEPGDAARADAPLRWLLKSQGVRLKEPVMSAAASAAGGGEQ